MTVLAPEHRQVVDALALLVKDELKVRQRAGGKRAPAGPLSLRAPRARKRSTTLSIHSQSVSYKWLAREFSLPATLAKQLLFVYLEEAAGGAAATYLVAGWEAGASGDATTRQHIVRLVPATRLDAARAALDPVTAVHVYSVAPCQPKDPADVWNADAAQSAALFAGLLKGQANALTDNRCAAVAGPTVAWAGRAAVPVPEVVPPPPAKFAPAGLLKVDPSKPPASAAAAMHAAKAAAAAPKKKKAGGGAGKSVISQIAAAAARPRAGGAATAQLKAEPMDEDEDEAPVRRRGGSAGRARAVVDTSDDDDDGAGCAVEEEDAPPSPAPAPSPFPSPVAAAKRPTPGAVKAGEKAGAKKRKVTKTTINARGEEVTEVVMEDVVDDDEDGGNDTQKEGGGGAAAPAPALSPPKAKAAGKKATSGAAAKKPSPAGGKKSGAQKSLLGFFGKK
jgi:hypothetical protein